MKSTVSKYSYFFIAVIAIFVVIFLEISGFLEKPKDFTIAFLIPVQQSVNNVGTNIYDFFRAFTMVRSIKEENTQIKLKNRELLAKVVQLDELNKENEILKKQLNIVNKEEYQFDMVDVVGQSPQNIFSFLLVNKGRENGIKEGMPVVTDGNYLVGKVFEVGESYSKVLLIYDGSSKISVMLSSSRIKGIIEGGYGYQMILDMIPRDTELNKEDIIITSGVDLQFPKGLILGKIQEIKKFDNQIFQQAIVKPLFEVNELEKVFILTNF